MKEVAVQVTDGKSGYNQEFCSLFIGKMWFKKIVFNPETIQVTEGADKISALLNTTYKEKAASYKAK